MFKTVRALIDGLLLHCPRCRRGPMFLQGFKMLDECPRCGLAYSRASGEEAGGVMINLGVTSLVVIVAGTILAGLTDISVWLILGVLGLFAILFPIAFYRSSRGLWVGFLYLTNANEEPD